MTALTARRTVGWHTVDLGAVDAEGNPVVAYVPPLEDPGTPTTVFGWGFAQAEEPEIGRVIHDLDLFVPADVTGKPQDVVDLPEGQYEVVGHPLDWTTGPFDYAPGKVVQLKRVTG